jgi:hypothetical protein
MCCLGRSASVVIVAAAAFVEMAGVVSLEENIFPGGFPPRFPSQQFVLCIFAAAVIGGVRFSLSLSSQLQRFCVDSCFPFSGRSLWIWLLQTSGS